jgi:hypothetical protein
MLQRHSLIDGTTWTMLLSRLRKIVVIKFRLVFSRREAKHGLVTVATPRLRRISTELILRDCRLLGSFPEMKNIEASPMKEIVLQ